MNQALTRTRRTKTARRYVLALGAAALGFGGLVAISAPSQAAGASTSPNVGPFELAWSKTLNDAGRPIALSSPSVGTLDAGGPAMIVGDRAGYVYAYHLSDGSAVRGWPVKVGAAVDSTASVTGSGPTASVYVGVGNSGNQQAGGYVKITAQGKIAWYVHPKFLPSGGGTVGVQNSLAIGNLQGSAAVVSGSMGQMEYALNAATGKVLSGFPWFEADTAFSTPALADLYGQGRPMIIEGGDSTAGIAFNKRYVNGGHLRILSPTGNAGTKNPAGGLFCEYNTDQVVQSSPAVGKVLARGGTGIVFGTGTFYPGAKSTNVLTMVDSRCRRVWSDNLGGSTGSSPALADLQGNGQLAVIEAAKGNNITSVFALRGTNGAKIWHTDVPGSVYGSVTTVSLNGIYQDVLVPTTGGLYVLDGRSGRQVARIWKNSFMGMQSSPLVTVDADGTVGLTMAGYKLGPGHKLFGAIEHYKIKGAPATKVTGAGSWPMFHHDVHLTGNASVAQPSGIKYSADTAVSSSAALIPEQGAATKRLCLAGGACVRLHVEGRTTTGSRNFGQYGYGYSSIVLDQASAGASAVAKVAVNRVLIGDAQRWLTSSNKPTVRVGGAGGFSAPVAWAHGCGTTYRVWLTYSIYYKDGHGVLGNYIGPAFRGFHC